MTHARPRLIVSVFPGRGDDGTYARMAQVLAFSAAQHCAAWDRRISTMDRLPLTSPRRNESHVANTIKMEHWCGEIAAAPDGTAILLMDADMLIVQPLDPIWERPFDLAYTTRQGRFPFNAGVMAMRVSERVRAFVERWRQVQRQMLNDVHFHDPWRRKFGGINQAALGYMLEKGHAATLRVQTLPCREWNCEASSWATFDARVTRIVHLQSGPRQALFDSSGFTPKGWEPIKRLWHDYDRVATEALR